MNYMYINLYVIVCMRPSILFEPKIYFSDVSLINPRFNLCNFKYQYRCIHQVWSF